MLIYVGWKANNEFNLIVSPSLNTQTALGAADRTETASP